MFIQLCKNCKKVTVCVVSVFCVGHVDYASNSVSGIAFYLRKNSCVVSLLSRIFMQLCKTVKKR